jgi:Na+/melibiose symporter-like transporter
LLWNQHHPWIVWAMLTVIGLISTIFMVIYYFRTRHRTLLTASE